MEELSKQFIGRGEVKGYEFRQLEASDKAFLYEVTNPETGTKHYEVFTKKVNTRFNCVSYPKSNAYGVWVWCIRDEEKARERYVMMSK